MDGTVLASDIPVTYLLFLEKQLADLQTFVTKLPVLDAAETWSYDEATDAYATPPTQTTRSKKVPRNHVKAEATEKHPAQVEMYFEDVLVGYWTTVKFSGALPQARVNELRARVIKLSEAVKIAREQANSPSSPIRRSVTRFSATCSRSRARRPFGGGTQSQTHNSTVTTPVQCRFESCPGHIGSR